MATERLAVILELVSGQYKREAKEAATATGQIGRAADTASGSVGGMTGSLNRGISAARAFVGVAAAGAIIKFGKDSVQAASDLEESMNAVNVVFGTASETITNFGEQAATSAGLAQAEFQQMASVLGSALINAGIPLDQAAEKTIELTQRAADMASVFNTTVPDALGAVQAALRGESDPIEKYGVTLAAAAVDAEAAALGFKKVAGQFDAQAKAAARLSLIMKQTDRVAGDFENTSDGLANKTKILTANMEDLQAQVGGYVIPILAELADEAVDATYAFGGFFDLLDKGIDALTGNAGAASTARDELDRYNSIFDFILPNITAGFTQMADWNASLDENAAAAARSMEAARFMADAQKDDLIPVVFDTIKMLDNQFASHSNVAKAADTQRTAMINLANAQADLLDPLGNVLRLQKESKEAQERLAEVQANGTATVEDLAVAVIEAEQAELRLQAAGAALTADQIQAFALILINDLGMSEQQALDTLAALNLLDGWSGSATFTLNMAVRNLEEAIAATGGGSGISNTQIQVRQHGGPVRAGWPYVVGEKGAELFIPQQSGMILPHEMSLGALAQPIQQFIRMGGTVTLVNPISHQMAPDLQYGALLANHATFGKF